MNIETANTIPVSEILNKMGASPVKTKGSEQWYYSPFRKEKTPSFHVNTQKNVWYDFGEAVGGDAVSLVCRHLEHSHVMHSPSEALRWLGNMFPMGEIIKSVPDVDYSEKDQGMVLKDVRELQHPALVHYLSGRGIPLSIVKYYLKEIRVYNTEAQKQFFAAGMKNEEGGYEYRNLYFKGCVGAKSITFIRGEIPKPPAIHIFEGFTDYLTIIAQREGKQLPDDTIILNSLSQMKEATAYIRGYGYQTLYSWLDNDEAGKKATIAFDEFSKTEPGLKHIPMNKEYAPYKDVNAAHMAKLEL